MANSPLQNQLLAALPEAEFERWSQHLVPVDLPLGEVLYESGAAMSFVYFPTNSIVSLLYVLEDGASAEIAVVGFEGLVGISIFMGGGSTPSRAVVQSGGSGYRMSAAVMKAEFERSGPVTHLLLRYTQALITQMAQTAVCNRHHSLDQQLCRWLLLSLDRLQSNQLVMTQELIANMLGVRREGVTEAALKLQKRGSSAMPGVTSTSSTGRVLKSKPASAMTLSKKNTTGCCPRDKPNSERCAGPIDLAKRTHFSA